MRIYICGPMTGLPGLNFDAFFEADKKLRDAGYDVLNPADRAGRTEGKPWDWYLRRCLADVLECDAIAVLPNWQRSKGAKLEVHVAGQLSIPTMGVDRWIQTAPFPIEKP